MMMQSNEMRNQQYHKRVDRRNANTKTNAKAKADVGHRSGNQVKRVNFEPNVDVYTFYTTKFDSYKEFENEQGQSIDSIDKYAELYEWVSEWVENEVYTNYVKLKSTPKRRVSHIPNIMEYKRFFDVVDHIADVMLVIRDNIALYPNDQFATMSWLLYDRSFNPETGSEMLDTIVRDIMCKNNGDVVYWYMYDITKMSNLNDLKNRVSQLLYVADAVEKTI